MALGQAIPFKEVESMFLVRHNSGNQAGVHIAVWDGGVETLEGVEYIERFDTREAAYEFCEEHSLTVTP